MKKIGVVGHFGGDKLFLDGQTVKTQNLYRALEEEFTVQSIQKLDTYGYKRNLISFFFKAVRLIFSSKNLVMLPDENGVRVFVPLYCVINTVLRRGLHYAVVGGWLPVFLKKHKVVKWFAKRLNGIYVETSSMKTALDAMGFKNVFLLPNFKYLDVLEESELEYTTTKPFKLCIFSRIMEQKGVEEAVKAVSSINACVGETLCELDLYGPIDSEYESRFMDLQKKFPDYIQYRGTVSSDKSVQTLKNYFALLFPTKFYTEGIPGTLIDACAAGVPVITALWANCADVFVEDVTGWGFEFGNFEQFRILLEKALSNPEEFSKMKITALGETSRFQPQLAIQNLTQRML